MLKFDMHFITGAHFYRIQLASIVQTQVPKKQWVCAMQDYSHKHSQTCWIKVPRAFIVQNE